jgi:hypothetical protein
MAYDEKLAARVKARAPTEDAAPKPSAKKPASTSPATSKAKSARR